MNVQKISNVVVGDPDTSMSKPSHVRGVREGNRRGLLHREVGMRTDGGPSPRATGRRSTGINASDREPIDPRMPILTPP